MSYGAAEAIARAVLFEGHALYPYRSSSVKNRQRWTFGTLFPRSFCELVQEGDASVARIECLVRGPSPSVRASVRFLQLVEASGGADGSESTWQEAVEQHVDLDPIDLGTLGSSPVVVEREVDAVMPREGSVERHAETVCLRITASATRLGAETWKLGVSVENTTELPAEPPPLRPSVQLHSATSAHVILGALHGGFVSLRDPPAELVAHAASCRSLGLWPVLVGAPGSCETLLASPVILDDYPSVAPGSPGDLFDGTEIDEILTLRILTLSEAERQEVLSADPRVRELLERTEKLGRDDILRLHGALRGGGEGRGRLGPGDRVVIRPRPGGDVLDLALAGEAATVASVEQDFEGRIHYAVTVDRDPGRDLGLTGQPGHRFFFSAEELEVAP